MKEETRKWIAAGSVLGKDANAAVRCPVCEAGMLQVKDEPITGRPGTTDRYLICPYCGSWNVLTLTAADAGSASSSKEQQVYLIIDLCRELQCKAAIKDAAAGVWSQFDYLFSPTNKYVETASHGPVRIADLEAIRIEPVVEQYIGRLVKSNFTDHVADISDGLKRAGIPFILQGNYVEVRF
jgi:hypothetical protein